MPQGGREEMRELRKKIAAYLAVLKQIDQVAEGTSESSVDSMGRTYTSSAYTAADVASVQAQRVTALNEVKTYAASLT